MICSVRFRQHFLEVAIIVAYASPLGILFRFLVNEEWCILMGCVLVLAILLNRLLRSLSPQLSSVVQVAVIPFEIDMPGNVNLDNRAVPFAVRIVTSRIFSLRMFCFF